jgi:alpha-L-arabinofuranosidase
MTKLPVISQKQRFADAFRRAQILKKTILIASAYFISITASSQVTAVLQADMPGDKISKHIYGHFAEHLGRCIYDGIYVGDTSKNISHTNGIRNDIIDALKKLKVANLRWPGGCYADIYHWKDGVGAKNKRTPIINRWWGNVTEDNGFGTHEFLELCNKIGAEPYLAANMGSGTVRELADWVEYVNAKPGSGPMTIWREQNGQKQPWNVKFWGVGNEAWGCGGNMTPDYYANLYKQYATFMADWGNSEKIYRVASGSNGSDFNWTDVLMRNVPASMMEGLSLHHYSVIKWSEKGPATGFSEQQYFATMKSALYMDELVSRHSTIMDKYDPAKKVGLVVDEWGGWYDVEPGTNPGFLYQQNTMRDAMIAGVTLNIFNKHCSRVRIANLAQTVNVLQAVILTNKEKMLLTPTYHVMEMYNVHQNAMLLPVAVNTPDYVVGNEKLPAVSVSASKDKDGATHISLVNIDAAKPNTVSMDLRGVKFAGVTGRILTSKKLQDFNSFDEPSKIQPAIFNNAKISGSKLELTLPPYSIVVLRLK